MEHWRSYMAGRLLELFNRREGAIDAYRTALKQKADFHRAANRLAYMLASLQRYAEAEPYFQAVLRADPGNAAAHFNLGYTFDQRGEHEKAIAAFKEAVRLNPKIDRAWYGMGLSHAALGQHEEAAQALREAATLQPMNPHAWYQLGMAYHTLRKPEKMDEVVMHLLRFDPRMTRRLILDSQRSDLAHLVKDLVV
jgi:tetratricopeptide (TPR) repeat protein